jgi:23S rRNA-/tRNA-specific pseudouridylate synthase
MRRSVRTTTEEPFHEHAFEVDREHKGLSLFDFLDAVAGPLDRKALVSAARARLVLLNGEPTAAGSTLREGDLVQLELPREKLRRTTVTELPVLYRDEELVVADKPPGIPFGESRRGGESTVERLASQVPGARPVHRLDKETSGVVLAGLGRAAEERLEAELRAGTAQIEYLAVARGAPPEDAGRVDVPLAKRRRSDTRLTPDPDHGDPAATRWSVLERLRGFVVLRAVPEGGGRSHQVRAHLAAAGLTVLCDALYGEDDRLLLSQLKLAYRGKRGRPERPLLARPALHAERVVRGPLLVESPLPGDLAVLLAQLRRLRRLA